MILMRGAWGATHPDCSSRINIYNVLNDMAPVNIAKIDCQISGLSPYSRDYTGNKSFQQQPHHPQSMMNHSILISLSVYAVT
jgi:hypothetical protein